MRFIDDFKLGKIACWAWRIEEYKKWKLEVMMSNGSKKIKWDSNDLGIFPALMMKGKRGWFVVKKLPPWN